jgi:pimeloyl-ACP methyl ester carboxylesterase
MASSTTDPRPAGGTVLRPPADTRRHHPRPPDHPGALDLGTRDPLDGADIARTFTGGFPDARLVLRDAGHIPWMEDPDGIAADVRHLLFDG